MTEDVVVTRKGQTTIPIQLRKKYRIVEGSRLEATDTGEGVLFKPKLSLFDLAGSGAGKATVKEVKELLEKLREEDA
jgi:AbrB family looped-hinge helix DNA binding protein